MSYTVNTLYVLHNSSPGLRSTPTQAVTNLIFNTTINMTKWCYETTDDIPKREVGNNSSQGRH